MSLEKNEKKPPLIVNFFGQPCAGKSTTAAGAFSLLKLAAVNCEYVGEYAKELSWEGRAFTLRCQAYIAGKQLRNMERLYGKVDVILTDSPLLLSAFYGRKYEPGKYPDSFYQFVEEQFLLMGGKNYFLERVKGYTETGRNQTLEEADQIADELREMLVRMKIPFTVLPGDEHAPRRVADDIIAGLRA